MSEQLKIIENHIKDLLFNKSTTVVPDPPLSSDLNYNPNSFPFNSKSLLPNSESPSDLSLNSSQLIDLNVLTNFAADINSKMTSDIPGYLPHPELENDLPLDFSLNSNTAQSQFSHLPAIGSEDANSVSDKKKRHKKNRTREKSNRKTVQTASLKESPNKKKNTSPVKQNLLKQEKKNEPLHLERELNRPLRAPLPLGETLYTVVATKEGFKFSCSICNYESRAKDYIIKHLESDNHKELKKQMQSNRVLPFLPMPLLFQIEAITDLLMQIHAQHGLSSEDLVMRKKLFARFQQFTEHHLPGCSVEMIGSSVTGLGLKKSKVDIALKVSEVKDIPDSLELLYKALSSDSSFCKVVSDFKKKKLGISFMDQESGLNCSLVLENQFSEKFARLFFLYSELDPRVKILASCFRHWAEMCSLDNQDHGTLPSIAFPIMLVYFLQQIEPPVLPVLNELKEFGNIDFAEKYVKGGVWQSANNCSVGELWLKLFRYYNFTYELGKHVICVRSSLRVFSSERNWATKFYAIEDPMSRRNIAHVIPNFSVCQYIQQCFLRTYRYFAFPQTVNGEAALMKDEEFENFLLTYSSGKSEAREDSSDESALSDNEDSSIPDEASLLEDFEDHDPDLPIENFILTLKHLELLDNKEEKLEDPTLQISTKADSPKKETKKYKDKSKTKETVQVQGTCAWDLGDLQIDKKSLKYSFNSVIFKGGKKNIPYSCKLCKSSGHVKKNCPTEDRIQRPTLPEMTHDFIRVINKTLYYIKDKNCVDDVDKLSMLNNMQDIEAHIRKQFPDANLSMFGSFCNGFGFKNRSDMDFCLTFKDRDSKDLDSAEVIERLAKHLQEFPKLENIVPVTSAKVPIVKFACRESRLEGDISLYNTLALANTEMLELYSKLDPRVQILGFALKYFAKVLGICDASRGSLSSYAYILMVIFYLQQREPPVIPVLQELHSEEKPTDMIDEWNVWYFKDIDKLPEIWPGYKKNMESPAELWLGLLSFYAYDFDWREYVVCIRQKTLLTRFRKMWITDQIAIEDPFDLNHNLGAGLSRKMNMYILRTFARGWERFGTPLPLEKIHTLQGHEVVYLFDRRFLNSGAEPPHDRGCRLCGKIGHIAKNCTQEKVCLFCKKTGHYAKNCPRKKQKPKGKLDRNMHENYVYDNKNCKDLPNQGHSSLQPQSSDVQRTNNIVLNHMSKNNEDTRKLLQMGYPTQRHPPPGFTKGFKGPPPGFLMHNNNMKFSRFPHPEPFPRSKPITTLSQSPPKHFNSSPPKNYAGSNLYHIEPPPPMGMRSGLLPDPHLPPPDPRVHRIWQNPPMMSRMAPQYMDRRKRTN